MTEELVIVRKLPEIEEHLQSFKAQVVAACEDAKKMVVTEETLVAVKNKRTELSKAFAELEDRRKGVKKQILAPYEQFDAVYKDCVSDPFADAKKVLDARIRDVEDELKAQKSERIRAYFDEYCEALGIDFVPFERVVPNIIRSVSDKKYKEQCAAFIDRVVDDLAMISEQEYTAEVRTEYKRTLNASQAVTTVAERHRAIEAEKARAQAQREVAAAREQAAEKVEEILSMPPQDEPLEEVDAAFEPPAAEPQEQEPVYEVTFTVRGTHDQIKELKLYLIERGYIHG